MKLISDSYLYQAADYNKEIFNYLMSADVIDKNSDGFGDVVYDVKRQADSILLKVLLSDKVVLLSDPNRKGVSRAFKVLYAKDIKNKNDKKKVYIDCTGIINNENGNYRCTKIGTFISYLFTAMVYVIYYNIPKAILSNHVVMKAGTEAFVDLMLYVFGYLKAPVTYADYKEKMSYVIAEYLQLCVVGRSQGEGVAQLAKNISGIKENKTCDYLHTLFASTYNEGKGSFKAFLEKFDEYFINGGNSDAKLPANRAKLTVDSFAQRWMYAYGPSTFLGLELFVPFSQLLTDCYIGSFINQQNTIEKVVGKNVVNFANELIKIGSENA